MKTRIAGLVLIVIAVTIVVVGLILPVYNKYLPTTIIWNTIFEDYHFSTIGLLAGISIALIWKTTTTKTINYLWICFSIGFVADSFVFSIFNPLLLFPGFLIAITALSILIASVIVFLIVGVILILT